MNCLKGKTMKLLLKKIILIKITFIFIIQNSYADFKNSFSDNIYIKKEAKPENLNQSELSIKKQIETENNKKKLNPKKTDEGIFDDFSKHNTTAPIYFQGRMAEFSKKNGILNLIGNVTLIQDNTTLTAEKAELIGKPDSNFATGSTSIQKAIATGNVKVLKKGTTATPDINASASLIEFLIPQKIMILKGKAKFFKAQEVINAEYIEINLDSGNIRLQDTHGAVSPKDTMNLKKNNNFKEKSNDKVVK